MTSLLSKWEIDYQDFWLDADGHTCEEFTTYLLDHFRWCWCDTYVANTVFDADIIESPEGSLIHQFDVNVVEDGGVCLKAGRLVAVYGRVGEIAGL